MLKKIRFGLSYQVRTTQFVKGQEEQRQSHSIQRSSKSSCLKEFSLVYEVVVGLFWIRTYEEQRLKPLVKRGLQVFRPIGRTCITVLETTQRSIHRRKGMQIIIHKINTHIKKFSNSVPDENPLLTALKEQ